MSSQNRKSFAFIHQSRVSGSQTDVEITHATAVYHTLLVQLSSTYQKKKSQTKPHTHSTLQL